MEKLKEFYIDNKKTIVVVVIALLVMLLFAIVIIQAAKINDLESKHLQEDTMKDGTTEVALEVTDNDKDSDNKESDKDNTDKNASDDTTKNNLESATKDEKETTSKKDIETTTKKEEHNNEDSDANQTSNQINDTTTNNNAQHSNAATSSVNQKEEETTIKVHNKTSIKSGALKVSGTHLVDKNGNIIQLKGLSTHGIGWYPGYINNQCFKQLKNDFGINVIRIAMYTAEYNGYCSGGNKEEIISLVDKAVTYATNNDLYVIIDWHILSDNNPNMHKDEAITFFKRMAKKYAGYNNVLYEICNEPNGGTSFAEIKSYAVDIIKVIRKYDKDGVILVGTPNWCQYLMDAVNDPIKGYDNIMYTLHFYAATHKDELRNTLKSALDKGLPVFVSEFGICDASGSGAIDEDSSAKWINLLNKNGISYVMWNISNKNETSSIFAASSYKTSGFNVNDLSEAGKWFLKMMTGKIILSKYEEETTTSSANNNSNNGDNNGNNENNVTEQQTTAVKKVTITATPTIKKVSSWESNGKTYTQYELTVKNNTSKACTAWKCTISFDNNISIEGSWNGEFSVSGKTLYIKSNDNNGSIAKGATVKDIGFIISEK